MDAYEILKQITIPSPCEANWETMRGDDRSRFCESCGKSVVNLSALPIEDAASLVASQGDHLCAKVTRRSDGSVVTREKMRFSIRSLMGVIAGIAAGLALWRSIASIDENETVGTLRCPTSGTSPSISLPIIPCVDPNANSDQGRES